ncbi:MAG TPA: carboxypeptidase-like regulatory domain-containing protein, partial [Saprospiraceae bacterium]|nr:carboxypeptidase-like regulatory domain-containing protein [Saprospiraceae bacterium]
MKVFISIIIICISISLSAQTSVKGRVIDQDSKAVDFASVFLFSAKDSSLVKAGYSEQNGNFQLDIIKGGKFFLKATIIGYQDYSSEVFDVSESEVRTFP